MTDLGQLAAYLNTRAVQRTEAVDRLAANFTPRELRLIREAAVMGYVQGAMNGRHRVTIPPDEQITREVMGACLSNRDLYPTITGGFDD